ncbi:phosphate regulon sensor histidine kinase PhoR [Parvibium lacunae]|uniref:Phosphate regulon sensor protein PhoR n=1 Tax=Parvibium lacunae TaxID=1888893 RepID=A0A368L5G1_9BURK|nr:phosphate regulon sensor histidine kinase PhoR [Parvibium lacunae]RCS58652.1 phosphate regulon sensor histidine kinase PhoR [Parvibium lacunae]
MYSLKKTVAIALLILLGWRIQQLTPCLLFAVILQSYWLYRDAASLKKFTDWVKRDLSRPLPRLPQSWEELIGLMYRSSKLRARQQHTLTQALLSFRSAAQAMPDGVITLDANNHIEWLNATAESQFSLQGNRDLQQPLFNFVRQPEVADLLNAQQWGKVAHIRNHRGQTLAVQFVTFGAGQKMLLARDITQLEKLETMRRDFVANVSHELKTPLTVLAGFLETLQEHQDLPASQQSHYIHLMNDQAQRMRRLVEDLLTLSALEASAGASDERWLNLTELTNAITEDAYVLSQQQHQIQLSPPPAYLILGNESELRSALGNLVSNAVRYTPPGGTISLSWQETQDQLAFHVADTGLGIEAQHLPRLTERFYRVDRARSHATGGTGLGLAIVKHALTHHQARLDVESELGKGSTFKAVFPLARFRPVN